MMASMAAPLKNARRLARRLSAAADIGRAYATVSVRRRLRGPKRPTWTRKYETLLELMRLQFGKDLRDIQKVRKGFDAIGRQELKRNRADATPVEVAGRKALWTAPRWRGCEGVVYYLHGGGYVVGSPESHRGMMASIAVHAGTRVLGIDYRLAPEHPCPAAIEDAVAGYRWLLERYAPQEIVIAGDSAGGGLSVATLTVLRDAGVPLPAGAVLLSPWTDLRDPEGLRDEGFDYIRPSAGWGELYGKTLGVDDPRVSPVLANLEGLPPMLILTGELELLAKDNEAFAAAARAAGVDARHHVEPDEVHVYPAFFPLSHSAMAGIGRMAQFIRERLDAPRDVASASTSEPARA